MRNPSTNLTGIIITLIVAVFITIIVAIVTYRDAQDIKAFLDAGFTKRFLTAPGHEPHYGWTRP